MDRVSGRKLELEGSIINLRNNSKWPNKLLFEFSIARQIQVSGGNLNLVSHIQLNMLMFVVIRLFLPLLGLRNSQLCQGQGV